MATGSAGKPVPTPADSPRPTGGAGERLDSWKEIAAYLRRDERTVRRWEKSEGLPVHRHLHRERGTVYAYRSELDAWWNNRQPHLEQQAEGPAAARRHWLWLVAGAVVVLALLAAGYLLRQGFWPAERPGRVTLAVLPVENLSGNPEQEYFSDGLTEEMITRLGRLNPERLGVIARTSAMQYKGTTKRTSQIGRELGVDYILEGSVRREADRVRVTAQLIRVSDQTHLWAQSYDRPLGDILSLQADLAAAVANEIQVALTPRQQARLWSLRGVNPEAHEAYLRGLHHLRKLTREGAEKAIDYFEQAVAKDPTHPLAYASLADAWIALSNLHLPPRETMPKAKAAALKSQELDDRLAEAHARLGVIRLFYDWDWAGAQREFQLALKLNPSLPEAHLGYADYLATQGRFEEALAEARQAYALDPLSPFARGDAVWIFYFARRYDEAIEQCQKVIELEPNFPSAHMVMALAYARLGSHAEALAAAEKARALSDNPLWLSQYVVVAAEAGQPKQARQVLDTLLQQVRRHHVCGYNVAHAFLALGQREQAYQWFERGLQQRSD